MNAPKEYADSLIPREDVLHGFVSRLFDAGRFELLDASTAPSVVNKLRHHYAQVYEVTYGQFKAANGEVLGFDTEPDPADDSYSYEIMNYSGYADWIGDDGTVMGDSSMSVTEHVGFMYELGMKFSYTVFDVERAVKQNKQLPAMRQRATKKGHDAKTNWTFLFGDPGKQLHGLFTHPNIQVALAPAGTGALATFGDNRDRLTQAKTVDEILADVATIIELVPDTTNEELRVRKVLMPREDVQDMKNRRVGAGDATLTIWQLVTSMHPDVEFMTLPECRESKRVNPKTKTNTSGVTGRCWIALPDLPTDECGFVYPRFYSQRPPQEVDLKIETITHSKIGGFKCVQPLGVVRLDFVADDPAVPAP